MKRSAINRAYHDALACFAHHHWVLPPRPRWDITDFGLGNFDRYGLTLINLASEPEYCEKLMYARQGQTTPCHTHAKKKEDIICRAGRLTLRLWPVKPQSGATPPVDFTVPVDGHPVAVRPGEPLILEAGSRVTLLPGVWHEFFPATAECIIGEVSTANDDLNDNFFIDPDVGRFPAIDEDEAAAVRLISDGGSMASPADTAALPAGSAELPGGTRSGILAAGNFIVDHVKLIDQWPPQDSLERILDQSPHNGGGPYNVLKDLAKLGARFPLAACALLGDDANGRWIRADCAAHGIDVANMRTTGAAATSYTDVMTVRGNGRRTFFHQPGANAHLSPSHFEFTACRARIFYLGYLLLLDALDAPGADNRAAAAGVFARARAAGLLTVLDCVSENSHRFGTVVAPVLPEVDILFANDFEAEKLTGLTLGRGPDLNRAAVEAAARGLLRMGVRRLVVLHFPQGACAATVDGAVLWQPAVALPPSDIAGASGAGDALAAGFLYAEHEGWPLDRAMQLAVCAAAASLRHPSCSDAIASADECLALGRRHGFVALP